MAGENKMKTASRGTVSVAKSRPRKNQSRRSDQALDYNPYKNEYYMYFLIPSGLSAWLVSV